MKWLLLLAGLALIGAVGFYLLAQNLLSECLPLYPDFQDCQTRKDRFSLLIVGGTLTAMIVASVIILKGRKS
ncbi:hypothetical protein AAG596_11765 [Citromicrobium bathyomarinum]